MIECQCRKVKGLSQKKCSSTLFIHHSYYDGENDIDFPNDLVELHISSEEGSISVIVNKKEIIKQLERQNKIESVKENETK